jgi:hypothetical protein
MKKTIMEKLGLEPVRKLNRSICLARVKELRRKLDAEDISSRLVPQAQYYARWYAWMARNGGTRAKKKAAA